MLLIELERSLSRLKPDGISFREKCKFGTLHRSVTTRVGDGEAISDLCASTLALGPFHYPSLPPYLPPILASYSYLDLQPSLKYPVTPFRILMWRAKPSKLL